VVTGRRFVDEATTDSLRRQLLTVFKKPSKLNASNMENPSALDVDGNASRRPETIASQEMADPVEENLGSLTSNAGSPLRKQTVEEAANSGEPSSVGPSDEKNQEAKSMEGEANDSFDPEKMIFNQSNNMAFTEKELDALLKCMNLF